MPNKDAEVDNHAHTDEEVGNEQGIADELQTRHQGTGLGNETVDYQSCKESTKQAFQSYHLCQRGTDEDERQDENVLHDAVLKVAKEPTADARKDENNKGDIERTAQTEQQPCEP